MTDSLKITLDLTCLPLEARKEVPVITGTNADQHGEIRSRGPRPLIVKSPLADTKMKFIVRADPHLEPDGHPVASHIDADLNLPNALVGHNLEHGTSVYAAGIAAMWLLKIWLAREGVRREHLDFLRPQHVRLRGVALAYLMRFLQQAQSQQFVDDIAVTARILRKNTCVYESTNQTVKMPTRAGYLVVYWKSLLSHCSLAPDAPSDDIVAANDLIARIEAYLDREFLLLHGLSRLANWENAYSTGLYAQLFEEAVQAPLRLNLRHNRPRPEVLGRLKPPVREYVEWYLAGKDAALFPKILSAAYPASAKSKLHSAALDECALETNIAWVDHQALRCHKLREVLVYPGDYHPSSTVAGWCFCRENWPALLARLTGEYERALRRWASA